MTRPLIRISQTDDLDLIDELDRICFPKDSRLGEALNVNRWWVAKLDGRPVAYAGMEVQDEGAKAFLSRAGVLPEARGGGLQKRLIRARVNYARALHVPRCWTYVWAGNLHSMNNLAACGFKAYWWDRQETPAGSMATFIYMQKKLEIPLALPLAA